MRSAVAFVMDKMCALSGHWAGCGLINSRILLFYDEQRDDFRVDLPSPTYRLWLWAIDAEWSWAGGDHSA